MNVEDKVLSIVASQVGIQAKEISLEDTTKTLCMDSLDKIETLMALEEEFYIEINDYQAEKFNTVQDVVDFIKVNKVYNQMSKESYNVAKEILREKYDGKNLHDVVTKTLYNPVKNISREKYRRCVKRLSTKLFRSNRNGSCLWMHLSKCGKYYYWCEYNSKNDIIYFRGEVDWVESNYDDYDQVSKDDVIVSFDSDGVVGDCKWDSRELGCDEEYVSTVELPEADEYTGSSVSYYKLKVDNPTTIDHPYEVECNDIIEALDMNYAEGNAFKALWRRCAARKLGLKKKGYDNGLYDAEKVVFFGERLVEQSKTVKA